MFDTLSIFLRGSRSRSQTPEPYHDSEDEQHQPSERSGSNEPDLHKINEASVAIRPAGIGGIALESPSQISECPSELQALGVSTEEYEIKMNMLRERVETYSKGGRGRFGIAVCCAFLILTIAFRYVKLNWIFFLWTGLGGLFSSLLADHMIKEEMISFQRDTQAIFDEWKTMFGITTKTEKLHWRQLYFQINFYHHQQLQISQGNLHGTLGSRRGNILRQSNVTVATVNTVDDTELNGVLDPDSRV